MIRNEDGLTLRSNSSVRRRFHIEYELLNKKILKRKLSFKNKFINAINSLKFLKTKFDNNQQGIINRMYIKTKKLIVFFLILLMIIILYYFFMEWHLLPYIESSKDPYSFSFYILKENEEETIFAKRNSNMTQNTFIKDKVNTNNLKLVPQKELNYGLIEFIIFHFLLFMAILCMILTVLKNPGYLGNKYKAIYSIPRFIIFILRFFLSFEEEKFNLDVEENRTLIDDLDFILKNESKLLDKVSDISKNKNLICTSMFNISIDITKRYATTIEAENAIKLKELDKISQTMCEDIIDNFDMEFHRIIDNDPELRKMNDLPFYELNENKRFCNFCLVKKPDRSHHCRRCGKCIRKMDHHCMFLYSCIGYANYKYFILFLFYSVCILIFMSITLYQSSNFYIYEYGNSIYLISFVMIYLGIIILLILIVCFFYLHLVFLVNNITTVDNNEKNATYKKLYNKGIYYNICSVMGSFLLWFIPYAPTNEYEGYSFEINKEIHQELYEIKRPRI